MRAGGNSPKKKESGKRAEPGRAPENQFLVLNGTINNAAAET